LDYLKGQLSYTLNRRAIRKFPRRKIFSPGIDHIWQADILQLPGTLRSRGWQKIKYVLTAIDVVSKFAWVEALSKKDAKSVTLAFEKILGRGRQPTLLQTDDGKEFINSTFQALLKQNGVSWCSTFSDVKAAIIERFHRTFMIRLNRYFTEYPSKRRQINIRSLLQDIVKSYNLSKHRSIGMAPVHVNKHNEKEVLLKLYPLHERIKKNLKKSHNLKVGNHVRVVKKYELFKKGYQQKWSKEIYIVHKVKNTVPVTYELRNKKGDLLKGGFYMQELQHVA